MRKEKVADIHINFRNEEEIQILINALKNQWSEYGLDQKGIALLIILEHSIRKHETENYVKEYEPDYYNNIKEIIND